MRNAVTKRHQHRRRRQTQKAGARLGQGGHATAYNISCHTSDESLCSYMIEAPIKRIMLYCADGQNKVIRDKQMIGLFKDYVYNKENSIAKIFGTASIFATKSTLADFEEEITTNRNIIDLFSSKSEYLTLGPLKGFNGLDLVGVYIEFESGAKIYASVGVKCGPLEQPVNLDKLIRHMLETIQILQTASFQHNDIKLDNILFCDERYKLLDWGQSQHSTMHGMKMGTLLATSPIRWYINGYSELIANSIITFKTRRKYFDFYKSPMFKTTTDRISAEFHTVLKSEKDTEKLHNKYMYSFDIFMLGMTVLHAVFKYKLDYATYAPIIDKFTSLTDPVRNAFEAEKFVADLGVVDQAVAPIVNLSTHKNNKN
jgi:serine/threonine protein kinase